ncbi:MAG TPA: hypothetical protein ENJ95_08580 [Bacteroidetes bacterium]|nr:hypothetical protein [Bacteroidota bacterium]
MKNLFFLFLLALAFAACKDDEAVVGDTATVNLNFKAVYSGEPFVTNNFDFQYKYPDGREIAFDTFNFFISDVVLLEENSGDEAELIDLEFINFTANNSLAAAEKPITFSPNFIPAGKYKGIRIGIGVPADINNSNYIDFGASHPLRRHASEFWSGWDSFVFVKLGGSYDIEGDGIGNGDDVPFAHQLASNAVYRSVTINTPIVVEGGKDLDLNIVVDALKLYQNDAGYLEMSDEENRATNDPGNLGVAISIVDNWSGAVSISQ